MSRRGERGEGRIEKREGEGVCQNLFDDTSDTRGKASLASIDTNSRIYRMRIRIDRVDGSCACVLKVGKGRVENSN